MKWLIGNKSAEKDIRDWLSENGYCGKTAKFVELELHSIKRPGWLQVFRFEFDGRTSEDQRVRVYGALRSDERYSRTDIFVGEDPAMRDARLEEWSDGLITQRRRD